MRRQKGINRPTERRISIHAPRVGCDRGAFYFDARPMKFQSTHPGWGATLVIRRGNGNVIVHFNPRTPGGVRLHIFNDLRSVYRISIHAPRVGCDSFGALFGALSSISIHAPRVGCDRKSGIQKLEIHYFNPRTPGGVRPAQRHRLCPRPHFNPRTPGGVRRYGVISRLSPGEFQSTHPGWGATIALIMPVQKEKYFNPRTPGGVRLPADQFPTLRVVFQSTHPGWGATAISSALLSIPYISIHAPRVGCD